MPAGALPDADRAAEIRTALLSGEAGGGGPIDTGGGGTGWLYLAEVAFDQLGFRTDLGTTPYPEFTRDFLYGVPVVLFGLTHMSNARKRPNRRAIRTA